MRKFKKILSIVIVLMLVLTMLPTSVFAAGTYKVYASKSTITVGKTTNLVISTTDAAGKFSVTSSNPSVATVSAATTWVDGSTMDGKITIKGVAEGTATITITPVTVADKDMNLLTNTKTIKITVKKASTTTTNTNTTTTTKSSDATLKSMTTNIADIDFNKNTTKYTVNVDKTVTSLGLKAVANNSKAKVKITGDEKFVTGENTVKVVVTAESGATKTYTITVVKSKYGHAPLLDLKVKGYIISPEFEPDKFEYKVDVVDKSSVNIEYKLADKNSKVTIQGNDNLHVGSNAVKVIVTEKNGTVTNYTVNVNVARSATEVEKDTSIWLVLIVIFVVVIIAETIYIVVKSKKEKQ